MSWTPEREEKLKELWKKGHSGSQIANILGNTNNCAKRLVTADVD